nr:hypothetical protein [Tanacetum cinerariifolium]
MPTKIELTLEQSQQGVSNDVLMEEQSCITIVITHYFYSRDPYCTHFTVASTIVTPSSKFPLAPVVAQPRIRRRRAILIQLRENIPIGRLYRTHPGGPYHFTSGSSSSHSSSDHSSSGYSSSGHSLSGHTPSDTTDADSSTPPRFVHPSLARNPRCSEAYLHWRYALLSTTYPPRESESSAGDSSSELSAGPSRKRCRSPTSTVTSSIYATRALVLSHADLLPPRKRFRDSISLEDSVEEDINTYVLEDIKADAMTVDVVIDRDVEAGVDTRIDIEIDVGVDVEDEVKDEVGSSDRGTIEVGVDVVVGVDIPDEIPLQRIEDIKTGQRELDARSIIVGGERASLLDQVASLERSIARLRGTMMMETARADSVATYEATHAVNALEAESQNQNGSDDDNGNDGNGSGGDGHGGNENGRNKNPNENNKDARFQELTMLCTKMVPEEEDQVERYIGGLPDNI